MQLFCDNLETLLDRWTDKLLKFSPPDIISREPVSVVLRSSLPQEGAGSLRRKLMSGKHLGNSLQSVEYLTVTTVKRDIKRRDPDGVRLTGKRFIAPQPGHTG